MKGDFSRWEFDPLANYSGVLYQQGRVRTDVDDNAETQITDHWRKRAAQDIIGAGVAAVPTGSAAGFKVVEANVAAGAVSIRLTPGRLWADGLHFYLPTAGAVTVNAEYLAPPLQTPQATVASITAGVRDAVVLDVWEESISAFQEPLHLIEPALGGPDTTERSRVSAAVKLMRLGPNDDCSAVAAAADDFSKKGKLTVSPAPAISIPGDCPLEAGGGYTGFEHYLYRVEIAAPSGGRARFKWSQFNGGLVGRGSFNSATKIVTITASDQMITHCGLPAFYLEALAPDALGTWNIVATADAALQSNGTLALTNIVGTWPAVAPATAFFRLWNGIRRIEEFPIGATPVELNDGILLQFDAAAAGNVNYQPGDYWTFPVRASGTPFDAALLPTKAPPQGIHHHRVPLAEITWNAGLTASDDKGEIDDCRHVFPPLTRHSCCCTFTVGDGVGSHGDFDSIEEALRQLPADGGEICLLPGLHQTNTVIRDRRNIRIHGCHHKTIVVPRKDTSADPIFTIVNSFGVVLEGMELVTIGGTAIDVSAEKEGGVAQIEIADNRIIACHNAIHVANGDEISVHHNQIRMLDKRDSGVAIYLAADDSLIERNDIRLVPAPVMPPFEPPDDPNPVDPNDPCARLEVIYFNPRIFRQYVAKIWLLPLLYFPILIQPYRALSGIQIGGGSERVRVLENHILGGAGNGITLGDEFEPPVQTPAPPVITIPISDVRILGVIVDPNGKGVASAKVTLTREQDGTAITVAADSNGKFTVPLNAGKYAVAVTASGLVVAEVELVRVTDRVFALTIKMKAAEPVRQPRALAFLYQISIVGNRIASMGMSGIGMPRINPDAATNIKRLSGAEWARVLLGNPVIGLEIRLNRILGCLKNPFDKALQVEAQLHGVGGISLGLCEDVAIVENRVEACGTTAVNPTCGVFIVYGEGVGVIGNHIVGNGPLPAGTLPALLPGIRGGIVLASVTGLNALAAINAGGTSNNAKTALINPRPAAHVHENVVDQPAGLALYIAAYGPISCTDNSFNSEVTGLNPLELAAGTVLIINIGGTQAAPAATRPVKASALSRTDMRLTEAPAPAAAETVGSNYAVFARAPEAVALLPRGHTLFSDNQSRTGAANTSLACQIIAAFDDLAYHDNQSHSDRAGALATNAFLLGTTLRAAGNRFIEAGPQTLMSLFTLAIRMNDTSLNQGDHCIIAVDQNPAMATVALGNQILNPGPLCARLQTGMTGIFRLAR
jgi:hypothetical protein